MAGKTKNSDTAFALIECLHDHYYYGGQTKPNQRIIDVLKKKKLLSSVGKVTAEGKKILDRWFQPRSKREQILKELS